MKILLIGGGTGGHILPLKPLVDELLKKKVEVKLVVANAPLDKALIKQNFQELPLKNIYFFQAGKIRRYLSFQNLLDFFRIIGSFWTAKKLLQKIRPDVIFFKGGFVGFPFLIATKFLLRFKGKIYCHESDISAGILTKLASRFSDKTFSNFGTNPSPLFFTPPHQGSGLKSLHKRKNILILGGSQGAEFLNKLSLHCHDNWLEKYDITLVSGKGKQIQKCHDNFHQFELLPAKEIAKKIQESDLVISRGGANSLLEIIFAQKPSIIIPLPSVARNHQFFNAQYFAKKGLCKILDQRNLTPEKFLETIEKTLEDTQIISTLKKYKLENSAQKIVEEILENQKVEKSKN